MAILGQAPSGVLAIRVSNVYYRVLPVSGYLLFRCSVTNDQVAHNFCNMGGF